MQSFPSKLILLEGSISNSFICRAWRPIRRYGALLSIPTSPIIWAELRYPFPCCCRITVLLSNGNSIDFVKRGKNEMSWNWYVYCSWLASCIHDCTWMTDPRSCERTEISARTVAAHNSHGYKCNVLVDNENARLVNLHWYLSWALQLSLRPM